MNDFFQIIGWVFDGIGTEIIALLIGLVGGGFAGYKIGIKKSSKQVQIAGDNAIQQQGNIIGNDIEAEINNHVIDNIKQIQKAGNYVEQIQVGKIKHEKK